MHRRTGFSRRALAGLGIAALVAGCSRLGTAVPSTSVAADAQAPPATVAPAQPAGPLSAPLTPTAAPKAPPPPVPHLVGQNGAIPILEYHAIAAQEGRWARTPAGLRADLAQLYAEGFRPVDLDQIGESPPPVPAGTHPVVLTFDDGLPSQFAWAQGGASAGPDPNSAVGILWQFHETHPDWAFAATFFVNAHPFGVDSGAKLRWLVAHGAEIGNHTYDHADLLSLDPAGRAAEIGRLQAYLARELPGYTVHSFAFPYGAVSDPNALARGQYQGASWNFSYLALVGAGPLGAQPPGIAADTPVEVPRIQVAAPETCPPSTQRFIWWGWQRDWLPTAHLYTVKAVAAPEQ